MLFAPFIFPITLCGLVPKPHVSGLLQRNVEFDEDKCYEANQDEKAETLEAISLPACPETKTRNDNLHKLTKRIFLGKRQNYNEKYVTSKDTEGTSYGRNTDHNYLQTDSAHRNNGGHSFSAFENTPTSLNQPFEQYPGKLNDFRPQADMYQPNSNERQTIIIQPKMYQPELVLGDGRYTNNGDKKNDMFKQPNYNLDNRPLLATQLPIKSLITPSDPLIPPPFSLRSYSKPDQIPIRTAADSKADIAAGQILDGIFSKKEYENWKEEDEYVKKLSVYVDLEILDAENTDTKGAKQKNNLKSQVAKDSIKALSEITERVLNRIKLEEQITAVRKQAGDKEAAEKVHLMRLDIAKKFKVKLTRILDKERALNNEDRREYQKTIELLNNTHTESILTLKKDHQKELNDAYIASEALIEKTIAETKQHSSYIFTRNAMEEANTPMRIIETCKTLLGIYSPIFPETWASTPLPMQKWWHASNCNQKCCLIWMEKYSPPVLEGLPFSKSMLPKNISEIWESANINCDSYLRNWGEASIAGQKKMQLPSSSIPAVSTTTKVKVKKARHPNLPATVQSDMPAPSFMSWVASFYQ